MSEVFEAERPRLFGLAYRMLGSVAEAEDAVQDAWLAWQGVDCERVERPAAYLTTVVTRRCIDVLRSARKRREAYPGPWLPEPLLAGADVPDETVELAESVRMAFLVLLEALSPAERAAFLLHDVFGYEHRELADILDRSEVACRQLVSRARRGLGQRRSRFHIDGAQAQAVAERFLAACAGGDVGALLETLHPDATLVSDGGGKVSAALRPIEGADDIARFLAGIASRSPLARVSPTWVNGAPGATVSEGSELLVVASIEVEDGLVRRVHLIRNPDKLRHLQRKAR